MRFIGKLLGSGFLISWTWPRRKDVGPCAEPVAAHVSPPRAQARFAGKSMRRVPPPGKAHERLLSLHEARDGDGNLRSSDRPDDRGRSGAL